jgi:Tfp pilus assembly protein PilX
MNNTIIRTPKNRAANQGFALVIAMVILTLLLLATMALTTMTNQSAFRVRRINRDAKALACAEAGIADMIAKLGTNYLYWQNNTTANTDFEGGAYSAVSQKKTNNNVLITSVGTFNTSQRTTVVELLGTTENANNDLWDIDGAILAGTYVAFASAAFTVNGNVHANGNITESSGGKNGDINGIVSAVGTIGDLDGTLQPASPRRDLPVFNIDSFRTLALNGGAYYPTNKTFSGQTISSSNGIIYVNGNVTIANKSTLNGTLVANGTVTIDNKFEQHNSINANYPAIICKGTIDVNNRTRWNGLLYSSGGNIILRNNMEIQNGVIANGYVDIKNNVTVTKGSGYPPWDPLNPTVPPEVIVGGWLK